MIKTLFLSQKTLFLGQKVWKKFKKVQNRVFRMFGIYGNCSIPNFPKITKNDVKLELQKLRKTRSDSKTNSKV